MKEFPALSGSQKRITIQGPFTDKDFALLMEALRYCERQQPDEKFIMIIEAGDNRPLAEIKELLKERFPVVRGVPVTIETFNRGD